MDLLRMLAFGMKIRRVESRAKKLIKKESLWKEAEKNLKYAWKYARKHIPFYRDKQFKKIKIKSIEDLQKLPVITPDIFAKKWTEFVNPELDISWLSAISLSSGSLGTSKVVPISLDDALRGYEIIERIHYTFRPDIVVGRGDVAVNLFPQEVPFTSANLSKALTIFYGFVNFPIAGRDDISKDIDILLNLKEKLNSLRFAVLGYPSAIYKFVQNLSRLNPYLLITGGEPVSHSLRNLFMKEMPSLEEYLDLYAATEGGIIGGKISKVDGYVVFQDRMLIEVDSKTKEIYITPLPAPGEVPGFLVFRYAIGDAVEKYKDRGAYILIDGIHRTKYTVFIGAAMLRPEVVMPLILQDLSNDMTKYDPVCWYLKVYKDEWGFTKKLELYIGYEGKKPPSNIKELILSAMDRYAADPAAVLRKGMAKFNVYAISKNEFEKEFPQAIDSVVNQSRKARHVEEILISS